MLDLKKAKVLGRGLKKDQRLPLRALREEAGATQEEVADKARSHVLNNEMTSSSRRCADMQLRASGSACAWKPFNFRIVFSQSPPHYAKRLRIVVDKYEIAM